MKKNFSINAIFIIGGVFITLCLYLLVTNKGILISERKVNPGEEYILEGYGDLGKNNQGMLVCKYFTGRKVITVPFWYSPSNILGRNSCKFIDDNE